MSLLGEKPVEARFAFFMAGHIRYTEILRKEPNLRQGDYMSIYEQLTEATANQLADCIVFCLNAFKSDVSESSSDAEDAKKKA